MSPEVNGNPPTVTKRKKNREKNESKTPMNTFELNIPSCNVNYLPASTRAYPNFSDISSNYYPFVNYSTSESMSLPVYPINYPGYGCPGNFMGSVGNISKHSTLSNHTYNINSDGADYFSLPIVNLDQNDESKRRFSDPGLPNESDSSTNSFDERTIRKLTQQINSLKENNYKLSREVMELRIELNLLKKQQNVRHFDRDYEPGMLTDVIREVREAARVREDALLARVKHIVEEKHLSVNHLNLVTEKNRNNDRISKLEEQLKSLAVSSSSRSDDSINMLNLSSLSEDKNKSARQVLDLERETLQLRRELQDTRNKKEEADQKLLQYLI
ncbi:uncharacterized protein LOC143201147 isoform X2 [Rhynchophorus ferrugineus]|uniref:uncharacterized protein LOC143201147 isoform X2 n=1 Tax=Rhynchophorus ferrugineus TaxID=354439 RepID=UPI003FCD1C34